MKHNGKEFLFHGIITFTKSKAYNDLSQASEQIALNKSLLEKNLSFYSLRHFGITARLYAKVPHYEVAKMPGTNVQFIEQHYEHLDMTKLRESAIQSVKYDEFGVVLSD